MTRVNRRKLETKCWLKAYESMQRDTSKRILQGKPLAAEGSLPEGHTSFGGNCTRETVLMSTIYVRRLIYSLSWLEDEEKIGETCEEKDPDGLNRAVDVLTWKHLFNWILDFEFRLTLIPKVDERIRS